MSTKAALAATLFALALGVSGHAQDAQGTAKLAGGFRFTEGPAADAAGNVFFTDIPNNRIHRWSLDGKLTTFLYGTGYAYWDETKNPAYRLFLK